MLVAIIIVVTIITAVIERSWKWERSMGKGKTKMSLCTQDSALQYEYHTYQGVFLDSTEHSDSKTAMGHLWCCSTQDNIRWELWFPCSTVLAAGQLRCKETRSVVGSCRSSHGSTTHASHEPVSLIATRLAQLSGFWQWTHQLQESPPSGEIKEHYPYQLFIVHW